MVSMANLNIPERAIRHQIANAVHAVVQVARLSDGSRKVITISEVTGPVFGNDLIDVKAFDLTTQHSAEPLGERIIVHGHVLDEDGRAVPNTLLEIWQANACGRYVHVVDQHPAPLDPNFTGAGRARTDADGYYKFITVKPGAYPWGNHHNAWRPAHIHFSVFGHAFVSRLVTQMYFPGDPLFEFDPIFNSVPDQKARMRMVSSFDMDNTQPDWALCYRFNIVLRGPVLPDQPPSPEWQNRRWQSMPAFEEKLSDEEAAALLSYVRGSWGNKEGAVTEEQVAKQR